MFSKTPSAKEWLEQLATEMESELNTEMQKRLNNGMVDLAGSIQQMAKMIDLKIRSSETILRDDHEFFSAIAEKRENVLRDLQDQFASFVENTESFTDESLFPDKSNLAPNLAAGSGIAAVGIILMTVSQLSMLDITGGVLTAVGFLFAGISTRSKRRQIVEGFKEEIQKGRNKLSEDISDTLKNYIKQLKKKIADNFVRFDNHLEKEQKELENLHNQYQLISNQLEALHNEVLK